MQRSEDRDFSSTGSHADDVVSGRSVRGSIDNTATTRKATTPQFSFGRPASDMTFSFAAAPRVANSNAVSIPPVEWAFHSKPKFRAEGRNSWIPNTALDQGDQASLMRLIGQLTQLSLIDNIDFPRVVVLGAENSGKSSTLEMVTNIPFPSSNGLTTTCPIVVERNVETDPEKTSMKISLRMGSSVFPGGGEAVDDHELEAKMHLFMNLAEVAEFLTRRRNRSSAITAALVAVHAHCQSTGETERDAVFAALGRHLGLDLGTNETLISNDTYVHLAVNQLDVEPITYIDLPGYKANRTQVQDDIINHNARIVKQNQETLILHVLRCTEYNLGNIPSQQPVFELDPQGERTINVLTSFDLMFDQERHYTDNFTIQEPPVHGSFPIWINELQLEKVAAGEGYSGPAPAFPSQRGFVAVRNRTTQERELGRTIADVKQRLSGDYDAWCTHLPDLLQRHGNAGAKNLEEQVIQILSSRMSLLLPGIIGHLLRSLAHIEVKLQQLSYLHGNTEGSTRNWETIVESFRSNIMHSLNDCIRSHLKVTVERGVRNMEPAVLNRLVEPSWLANFLVNHHGHAVGDPRRQEEFLGELWEQVQTDLSAHLNSTVLQLQQTVLRLLNSVILDGVEPPQRPSRCGKVVLHPDVTESTLQGPIADTTEAFKRACREVVSSAVDPITELGKVAHAELQQAVSTISSNTAIERFQQMFAREVIDFYRKEWYLNGLTKARRAQPLGTTKASPESNAYDLAYAVKELYDQSVANIRSTFIDAFVAEVDDTLNKQFGEATVSRWLNWNLERLDQHPGWHEARRFLSEKRGLYTNALRACVSFYQTGVDVPYVLVWVGCEGTF